ncbi:MAG TPA: calcium-binding protein [Actinomycetota bacterium]
MRIRREDFVLLRWLTAVTMLLAIQVVVVANAQVATAVTSCNYDPATGRVEATIDPGESAGLAVNSANGSPDGEAPPGAILFDPNGAGFDNGDGSAQCGSATVTNTTSIQVLGSGGGERFTIDNYVGGEFATPIEWAVDLGSNSADTFTIRAGSGADEIVLGDGTFSINGGGGQIAGAAAREVFGNEGDDTIDASAMTTGVGLFGMDGFDTLIGGAGADRFVGGDDDDRLLGGAGDDQLDGGENVDRLYGGDGADTCLLGRAIGPCDPSISLGLTTLAAGDPLSVSGAGWYPENGDVELAIVPPEGGEPQPVTVLRPSLEEWTVEGTITAPSAGGDYTLLACQPCDDPDAERATQLFTVVAALEPAIAVEPATALPGASVLVSGEGWDAGNGPISLFAELPDLPPGEPFATVSADDDGRFQVELELGDLATGSHEITACQRCGAPDEVAATTSFVVQAGTAPTFHLLPPSGAPGETLRAVGEGWDPERGRIRLFVDPSSTTDQPDEIAGVRPDGTFEGSIVVPELDAGAYTVLACQRCNAPNPAQQTATLTVPSGPSPLPWILATAAVVVLAVGGGLLARAARPSKRPPGAPEVRLRAAEPTVNLVAEKSGATKHEVRLIPRADPGVQRVREGSPR